MKYPTSSEANNSMTYTYRATLSTEQEAKELCRQLIHGGIIQKQESGWVVWQLNQP